MYRGVLYFMLKTKLKTYPIFSLLFALSATLVTPYILKDQLTAFSLTNSVFSVLIFVGYFFLFKTATKHIEKKKMLFSVALGFVYSVFMVLGKNVMTAGFSYIFEIKTWIAVILILPVFSALALLCLSYVPFVNAAGDFTIGKKKLSDKTTFFILFALIFIAWIPILLASYPGVYGYDSVYQINMYRSGEVSLHHPIIHTYLLGFFVLDVGEILGSYEAGMCCYSIFQMLCLSATFSAIYTFYVSKRWKNKSRLLVLLLIMFLPTNPIMAFSGTKDVIFAAFFALSTMLLLMVAENPERIKSIKFDLLMIGSFFLMTIFRNQGKFLVAAAFVFAFIFLWKYKKNLILVLASFLILIGVYNGPVTKALGGVEAAPIREMLSVPCVQLARAINYNADELTEEECQLIKEYIPRYAEYGWNAGISDAFKNMFDDVRFKENPTEFIKLWMTVALKCPQTYIDAFLRLTVGYWYPDMNYRDPQAYHPYWEYAPTGALVWFDPNEYVLLEQTPVKGFGFLNTVLFKTTYSNAYQYLPVVPMLLSSGMLLWSILMFFVYILLEKKFKYFIPLAFIAMMYVTLFLGPVVLFRYIYPIVMIMPMLFACAFNIKKEKDVC